MIWDFWTDLHYDDTWAENFESTCFCILSKTQQFFPCFELKVGVTVRTDTPWDLTDDNGNSTESTGGHVGQHVATGGKVYSEFHQWPSVDHWWKLTIFEVITWYAAHLDAERRGKNYMQLSWKFCYNVFRRSNYAIKVSNSTIFEDMDAGLVSNDTADLI